MSSESLLIYGQVKLVCTYMDMSHVQGTLFLFADKDASDLFGGQKNDFGLLF